MVDKIFGQDFTNETSPTTTMTITVFNGATHVDVQLQDLIKAIPALRVISASDPTVNDDSNDGYKRGDMWLNTATGRVYMAWVVTPGAAGWLQISNNVQDDLDGLSSTQGAILYRGASDWAALNPGTSGQVLQSGGASANPSWATPSSGGGYKHIITPSITSNNLVLALKYLDGNDPSSTNPLTFRIGNAEYTVTAAMSFTKNAGTNWMNMGGAELASQDVDLFLYAIGETGGSAGIKFGYSRIPYATSMSDFVNTTTSEKYIAGNWTNFNGSDYVQNIGRFRARLSAGAGYTWSIPNSKVISRPIYETDWLAYTPTGSPSSGAFTTASASGVYNLHGTILDWYGTLTITNNGTGTGAIYFTLPILPSEGGIGAGREISVVGTMLQVQFSGAASALLYTYNNTYPGASGYTLKVGASGWRLV